MCRAAVISCVIGLEGWLVPRYDACALAERICALAQDRQLLGQAGINARQRITLDFTETYVMAQVSALYQSFAAKQPNVQRNKPEV